MSVADELAKLQQLYQSGALNDDEYATAKAALLKGQSETQPWSIGESMGIDLSTIDQQTNFWGMMLHLSLFAVYIVPLAGIIAPIVIWQLKKDQLPGIDAHGKNAINWIISHFIYAGVCIILTLLLIGIPLLIALGVASVAFPIIAAIKANNGEIWKYPTAISFLK